MYITRPWKIEPYNNKCYIKLICTYEEVYVQISTMSDVDCVPLVWIQFMYVIVYINYSNIDITSTEERECNIILVRCMETSPLQD